MSCGSGYELSGDRILVCSSGSWSGNVGACEEGNCYISFDKVQHKSRIESSLGCM